MPPRIRRAQPLDLDHLAILWKELTDFHAALDPKFALAPDAEERWRENASPDLPLPRNPTSAILWPG